MSLRQQYPAEDGGQPDRFEGPFVGRDEYFHDFVDAVNVQGSEDLHVLVYHGIGGIGKTRLAHELGQMLDGESSKAAEMDLPPDAAPRSQFCWARIDFEVPERRRPARGLYHLRTQLSGKYGLHFPTFDLAFAEYWSKAYPEAPLPEPDPSFIEEHGDFLLALLDAVGEVPVAGLLTKIPKHVDRLGKIATELYRKRNEEALQGVPNLPADEIEKRLPGLWTHDFNNQIDEADKRAILFFDTYEALREGHLEETKRHEADRWIRELVKGLPGTLIVVTGHEKLYWPEIEEDWETVLRQRHLGELPPSDARRFLADSGIEEVAIRDRIVETASGVPSDLVLAFDLYQEMKRQNEEPTPEDFGETPRGLFERFFRYLGDDEMAILELLAVPRSFTRDIAEALAERFDPGFPVGQFARLRRFAFVSQLEEGQEKERRYSLHERARDAIREYTQFFPEAERIHEFLFEYHAETLQDLKPREVGPRHEQALREAFYHGQQFLDVAEFGEWFFEKKQVFNQGARWQVLEILHERLLSLQKATFGEEHPQVARTLNNIAGLYRKQGEYEEAESLYERALKIRRSVFGKEHPQVAETLNTLGVLYWNQGRYKEAEPRYEQALEIQKLVLGEKHLEVGETLNNLAVLYRVLGRYQEAASLHDRALEIRELALGEEHPRVAETLDNLAALYVDQGEYEEAEPRYKRALEIRESALGKEHPRVANTLNNLGVLYGKQERYKEAESHYERARKIWESAYGEEHFRVATAVKGLAVIYRKQQEYEEAERLLDHALEIEVSALGDEHPRVANTQHHLAVLHREQGRHNEAESLYDQALEIRESTLGKVHPRVAETLKELATLYNKQQQQEQAGQVLERALAIARQELGETHPETQEIAASLKDLRAEKE